MVAEPTSTAGDEPHGLRDPCRAVAEHAPLPMAAVEGDGYIVCYVNPAFCSLIDQPEEQLIGKSFRGMLPAKDECVAVLDRVFRTGNPESHTEREHFKPHSVFLSYTMWPVMVDERPVCVMIQVTETARFHETTLAMNEALMIGSLRQHELTEVAAASNAQLEEEILDRKHAEEALRLAQAMLLDRAGQLEGLVAQRTAELTATNEQLEAFVYSIAHDLRAPLRAMQGFTALLLEEAGSALSETAKDYASRINSSAQFMDALLSDLLAFSHISQQAVELTSVSLKRIVESVISRLQKDIQQTHARVETPGPWPSVLAHEPTLAQVLFNLVSNALKFVNVDGPPVLRLRAEELPKVVRVWVEDNGPGIAPAYQSQIFQLFTRLKVRNIQARASAWRSSRKESNGWAAAWASSPRPAKEAASGLSCARCEPQNL